MNRQHLAAAAVLAASITLTGCAASPTEPTAPESEPAATETAELPTEPPPAEPSVAPTPTPTPTEESVFADRGTSERGDLIKEVGDLAGLVSNDDDTRLVDFTVTAIRLDPECTSGYSEEPVNGHFLALDFEITTYPELAEEDDPQFFLTVHDMVVFNPDGSRLNDSAGNGYSCLSNADHLPAPIGAAETVKGSLVLDVAQPTGTVAVRLAGDATGWEWSY